MMDVKQKIFPICNYGRAENVFFQSADSLTTHELSLDEIRQLTLGQKIPLFPSHLLDRSDWESLAQQIMFWCSEPRVQVSVGREWDELGAKIEVLQKIGWGLDILIDRPLDKVKLPSNLSLLSRWRWIICPLKLFAIEDIKRSFDVVPYQAEIFWCFLEPKNASSLLLNADEIILAKQSLRSSSMLNLIFPQPKKNVFYEDISISSYQNEFVNLGQQKIARQFVFSNFKSMPWLLSAIAHLASTLFSEGLGTWTLRRIIRPLYWKAYSFRQSLKGLIISLLTKTYWTLKGFLGSMRYWTIRSYWRTREISQKIFFFSTWPFRKFYWFSRYQVESKFHPLVLSAFKRSKSNTGRKSFDD